jgi:hypothetical protein
MPQLLFEVGDRALFSLSASHLFLGAVMIMKTAEGPIFGRICGGGPSGSFQNRIELRNLEASRVRSLIFSPDAPADGRAKAGPESHSNSGRNATTAILSVQDDIAQAIARALQLALCDRSAARNRGIPDLPAYEAYLKGLHQVSLVTLDSLTRGRD